MAVFIVRYQKDKSANEKNWGVLEGDLIRELPFKDSSLGELLNGGRRRLQERADSSPLDIRKVHLLSPVTAPCQIVCQGLNYKDHAREVGIDPQILNHNTIFTKFSASICAAGDTIFKPEHVELLDYELELGVIIGRPISGPLNLVESQLSEYVAGVVIANDVSARDVQLREGQWTKAKSYPTFCPTGPYFCWFEPEDFKHLYGFKMQLKVNGEIRQDSNSGEQVFRMDKTLNELSSIMQLNPGDMILTGTPGGVALAPPSPFIQRLARILFSESAALKMFLRKQRKNPRYLRDGDLIEARIWAEGGPDLGRQTNRVTYEARKQ